MEELHPELRGHAHMPQRPGMSRAASSKGSMKAASGGGRKSRRASGVPRAPVKIPPAAWQVQSAEEQPQEEPTEPSDGTPDYGHLMLAHIVDAMREHPTNVVVQRAGVDHITGLCQGSDIGSKARRHLGAPLAPFPSLLLGWRAAGSLPVAPFGMAPACMPRGAACPWRGLPVGRPVSSTASFFTLLTPS